MSKLIEPVMTPEEIAKLIAQSFIINQIALNYNEYIKRTKFYKHDLKLWLGKVQKELIKAEEKNFDIIYDSATKETRETYDGMVEAIKVISSLGLHHLQPISEIVKAYKKDPDSIQKLVNKINK